MDGNVNNLSREQIIGKAIAIMSSTAA